MFLVFANFGAVRFSSHIYIYIYYIYIYILYYIYNIYIYIYMVCMCVSLYGLGLMQLDACFGLSHPNSCELRIRQLARGCAPAATQSAASARVGRHKGLGVVSRALSASGGLSM